MTQKKILLHQDNAALHTLVDALAKIHKLTLGLVDQEKKWKTFLPVLAPSDYFLFPNF